MFILKLIIFFIVAVAVPTCNAIIGGRDATSREASSYVGVRRQDTTDTFPGSCGGYLIALSWTGTAGHCIYGANSVIHLFFFGGSVQTVPYTQTYVHPLISTVAIVYDYGLIKHNPVTNGFVSVLLLPCCPPPVGTSLIITGGGVTDATQQPPGPSVQSAPMRVISVGTCIRDNIAILARQISSICLKIGPGISACFGDSGSPGVYECSQGLFVVGSCSFAPGTIPIITSKCDGDAVGYASIGAPLAIQWFTYTTGVNCIDPLYTTN